MQGIFLGIFSGTNYMHIWEKRKKINGVSVKTKPSDKHIGNSGTELPFKIEVRNLVFVSQPSK